MTDVTIVNAGAEPPVIEGEVITPPVAEAVSEAAIEIAEIQADRDITLAAIAAESAREQVEALGRDRIIELEAELSECRNQSSTEIAALMTELSSTRSQLEALTQPQSPPPEESVEKTLELPEEVIPEAVPEPVKKRRGLRWI